MRRLGIAWAMLLLAACGGGGTTADAGTDLGGADLGVDGGACSVPFAVDSTTVTTVAGFREAYREAACDFKVRCGDPLSLVYCEPRAPTAPPGRPDGALDATAVQECLDALLTGSCDTTPVHYRACERAVVATPAQAIGAPCLYAGDCASGACSGPSSSCGFCIAPAPFGGACSSNSGCIDGTLCLGGGTCGTLSANGDPCTNDADCDAFLACGADHHCAPAPTAGAPCSTYQRCAMGLACTTGGTCAPAPPTLPAGAPCSDGTCGRGLQCGSVHPFCRPVGGAGCACVDSSDCGASDCIGGVCVARPALGEACDASSGLFPCAVGVCTGDHCVLGAAGDVCVVDDDCTAGLRCATAGAFGHPMCTAPAALGASCVFAPCADGLVCSGTSPTCAACPATP